MNAVDSHNVPCAECWRNGTKACPFAYIPPGSEVINSVNIDPEFYCAYGETKKNAAEECKR